MPGKSRRVTRGLQEIDEWLFEANLWFVIDAENRRIPRVSVSSLDEGMRLLDEGAAAVVGRLRREARVVDIDVDGWIGDALAEQVASWAGRRGLWCLVRPSGGAPGRAHIFVAGLDDDAARDLADFAAALRKQFHLATKQVDVRLDVRPLSSPHRRGANPLPVGSIDAKRNELRRVLPGPVVQGGRRRRARQTVVRAVDQNAPLPGRTGPRRALPPQWAAYLDTGERPKIGGADHSRTTYEAIATGALFWAGYSCDDAWAAIQAAHPRAMTRARENRDRWVRYVWNRTVRDARTFAPAPSRHDAATTAVQELCETAVTLLHKLAWEIPVRQRPTFLRIGYALLDRMARTGALRVPCPERDLVLDTGIADRATLRLGLRQLHAAGFGVLHRDSYRTDARSSSSFEFTLNVEGVRQIHPPSSHNPPAPLPSLAPGVWAVLPTWARPVYEMVRRQPHLSPAQLAQAAGMTLTEWTPATVSSVRTVKAVLRELGRAGMVQSRLDGSLTVSPGAVSDTFVRETAATQQELEQRITAERRQFRQLGASEWARERGEALWRERQRHAAWWRALGEEGRAARRAVAAERWQTLEPQRREACKALWAEQRRAAGAVSEQERHTAWISSLSPREYEQRSKLGRERYLHYSPTERRELARGWDEHRRRYGISRGPQPSGEQDLLLAG